MYICIYIHTRTYIHICICVHYVCICKTYVFLYTCIKEVWEIEEEFGAINVCTCMYMHVYMYVYVCVCMCMYVYMYINVYICKTYACVCIYIKEVWEIEEEESGVGTRPGAEQAPRAGVMGWLEVFFF